LFREKKKKKEEEKKRRGGGVKKTGKQKTYVVRIPRFSLSGAEVWSGKRGGEEKIQRKKKKKGEEGSATRIKLDQLLTTML